MEHDIESARRAQEACYRDVITGKNYNMEQWKQFFMSIYNYVNQPGADNDWSDEFAGCGVVDIRTPGNSLLERWPHYFGVPASDNAKDWEKYGPDSQEFDSEFAELRDIYRKVRAHADAVNREAIAIAQSHGYNV